MCCDSRLLGGFLIIEDYSRKMMIVMVFVIFIVLIYLGFSLVIVPRGEAEGEGE